MNKDINLGFIEGQRIPDRIEISLTDNTCDEIFTTLLAPTDIKFMEVFNPKKNTGRIHISESFLNTDPNIFKAAFYHELGHIINNHLWVPQQRMVPIVDKYNLNIRHELEADDYCLIHGYGSSLCRLLRNTYIENIKPVIKILNENPLEGSYYIEVQRSLRIRLRNLKDKRELFEK